MAGLAEATPGAHANLEDIDLVAMCDINRDALNDRADEYGVSNRYTDYEEMFTRESLDIVSVCTHAPLHAPIAIAAAQAGVHVLSEKPLSVDLETGTHGQDDRGMS